MKVTDSAQYIVLDARTHRNERFTDLNEAEAFALAQIPVSRALRHIPSSRRSIYSVWHADTERVASVVELGSSE